MPEFVKIRDFRFAAKIYFGNARHQFQIVKSRDQTVAHNGIVELLYLCKIFIINRARIFSYRRADDGFDFRVGKSVRVAVVPYAVFALEHLAYKIVGSVHGKRFQRHLSGRKKYRFVSVHRAFGRRNRAVKGIINHATLRKFDRGGNGTVILSAGGSYFQIGRSDF